LNAKQDIRFRVYVAFTCICLMGLAVILKVFYIQTKEGSRLRQMSREMHTRTIKLPAERGNIYTENGVLLCSTIPQFDVHVDFSVIDKKVFDEQVDTLAKCMSALFKDASYVKYKTQLTEAYNKQQRYWLLKKNLQYFQYQALRTFPIFNKGQRRGGLIAESKVKRINPYGMLAYRTIGLWRENSQTIGMEATYDSVLNGETGSRIEQKESGGIWMPVDGAEIEAQNGKDIVTTLDMSIQDVAEHALLSVLKQYECLYGTCIVMEVETGKIKALVNLGRQKDGSYWEDFNYAMIPTEPGSTFKLVTLYSLLSDKFITVEDKVNAEGGAIRFGNRTMRDSHLGLGTLTIRDAFAHSSNAAMAKLAYKYYAAQPQKFIDHLRDLHLHERTGIDLAGERRPLVKTPENKSWSATTLPWMATGYEVLVSPLHTCMVYNAVANNGKMMRPYLISSVREYGKDVKTNKPKQIANIGDSSTIAQLQACVKEVVLTGTGKTIQSPFYTMAGKTGTAQVADKGIKYTDGVYQGSFVGYFPADKPKYTIAVVVRTKPHSGAYYGGTIAAPVFRMVADRVFAYGKGWDGPLDSISKAVKKTMPAKQAMAYSYKVLLNSLNVKVPVEEHPYITQLVSDTTSKTVSVQPAVKVTKGYVPDVNGMGLKDAIYLLEKEGLQVQVRGKGRVQLQSIPAGTKTNKGEIIVLQLS
jgi:cell division protein FtsI (penicillin-binding protein 3)